MREYLVCFLVAAAVTYLLTPAVRRLAISAKAMAEVRDRDISRQATPRWGGLAMYAPGSWRDARGQPVTRTQCGVRCQPATLALIVGSP